MRLITEHSLRMLYGSHDHLGQGGDGLAARALLRPGHGMWAVQVGIQTHLAIATTTTEPTWPFRTVTLLCHLVFPFKKVIH